jgi:hypothetical protein
VYTEVEKYPQPHEYYQTTYNTYAQASYRIRVFTQAQFDNPAILATTDNNLANDAQDRCLILAKVTANGAGVSLTSSSIQLATVFENLMYAVPSDLITITGVSVLAIDPDCPTGLGTITFDGVDTITWTSPGGVASAAEVFTIDEIRTFNDGSGYWIKIQVIVSLWPPLGGAPYSETFDIYNLYEQEVPRFSAEDFLHRDMVGTGVITPRNPHGLSIDDITDTGLSYLDEHQDVEHCNGIWKADNPNYLDKTIFAGAILGGVSDTLYITNPASGDIFYINGKKLVGDVTPNSFVYDSGSYGTDTKFIQIYVDDDKVVHSHTRAQYPAGRQCTGTWIIDMSPNHPAGNFNLAISYTSPGSWSFTWNGGYAASIDAPYAPADTHKVLRLYGANGVDWIDLCVDQRAAFLGTDGALPAGAATDSITVLSALDPGTHMEIMCFPYWYNSGGPTTEIGVCPTQAWASRYACDKRPWGTLDVFDMADSALKEIAYNPTQDFNYSGVIKNRNNRLSFNIIGSTSTPYLRGGLVYCRGKRMEVSGLTLPALTNNTDNLVWVDYLGDIHVENFALDPYLSDLDAAIRYIVGQPVDRDPKKYEHEFYTSNYEHSFPERGVPLWLLTMSAGSITYKRFIGRVVGAHIDPWSVGSNSITVASQTESRGAFRFLDVAVAYVNNYLQAEYADNGSVIDLKITGYVAVDREVTIPSNVILSGSGSDTGSTAYIKETLSGAPVGLGVITLSDGCVVRDLRTYGGTNALFSVCNDTIVFSNVTYGSAGATFIAFDDCNDVTIKDCKIYQVTGTIFTYNAVANRLKVLNNNFQLTGGLVFIDALDIVFSNNTVQVTNSGGSYYGPAFNGCTGGLVSNNSISLNLHVANVESVGIALLDCLDFSVLGNSLAQLDASSYWGIGVHVGDGCSDVVVSENRIFGMGIGILGGVICSFLGGAEVGHTDHLSITNNYISGSKYHGILIAAEDAVTSVLKDITILGNTIANTNRTDPAARTLFQANVFAIGVYVNYDSSWLLASSITSFKNLVIANNNIEGVKSSSTNNVWLGGVAVWAAASAATDSAVENIVINGNNISGIDGSSGDERRGVSVNIAGGTKASNIYSYINGFDLCNNSIIYAHEGVDSFYAIRVLFLDKAAPATFNPTVSCVQVNSNIIKISDLNVTYADAGIFMANNADAPLLNSSIDNNKIICSGIGIEACLTRSSISGNNISSYIDGIYSTYLVSSSIERNNIVVQTEGSDYGSVICWDNDAAGALVSYDAGCFGIRINPVSASACWGSGICNNVVELVPRSSGTAVRDSSACIYVYTGTDLKIAGNTTKVSFSVGGLWVTGGSSSGTTWHCLVSKLKGHNFIEGNKFVGSDMAASTDYESMLRIDCADADMTLPVDNVVVSNNSFSSYLVIHDGVDPTNPALPVVYAPVTGIGSMIFLNYWNMGAGGGASWPCVTFMNNSLIGCAHYTPAVLYEDCYLRVGFDYESGPIAPYAAVGATCLRTQHEFMLGAPLNYVSNGSNITNRRRDSDINRMTIIW